MPLKSLKIIQNSIGRKLRNLRTDSDLSQEYVAFETQISRDHISNLEHGKHPINLKTLYKLANFYNVELKIFFE